MWSRKSLQGLHPPSASHPSTRSGWRQPASFHTALHTSGNRVGLAVISGPLAYGLRHTPLRFLPRDEGGGRDLSLPHELPSADFLVGPGVKTGPFALHVVADRKREMFYICSSTCGVASGALIHLSHMDIKGWTWPRHTTNRSASRAHANIT